MSPRSRTRSGGRKPPRQPTATVSGEPWRRGREIGRAGTGCRDGPSGAKVQGQGLGRGHRSAPTPRSAGRGRPSEARPSSCQTAGSRSAGRTSPPASRAVRTGVVGPCRPGRPRRRRRARPPAGWRRCWSMRRKTGRSRSPRSPSTATSRPVCAGVGEPLGLERGDWRRPRRRRATRAGGAGVVRRRRGRARSVFRSSPSAVTSRTVNPRWDRCSAIEAVGGDRGLERRRDALTAVGLERGCRGRASPGLPRLLLAPHHQLAGPGAAAPVHAPQVVAAAVLADGHVLRAAGRERARPVVAGAGPCAGERDRRQRDGARG